MTNVLGYLLLLAAAAAAAAAAATINGLLTTLHQGWAADLHIPWQGSGLQWRRRPRRSTSERKGIVERLIFLLTFFLRRRLLSSLHGGYLFLHVDCRYIPHYFLRGPACALNIEVYLSAMPVRQASQLLPLRGQQALVPGLAGNGRCLRAFFQASKLRFERSAEQHPESHVALERTSGSARRRF
eukprot:COSAG05_NODE_1228_length_5449_cov_51.123178_7_plen_184_part_00